MCGRSGVPNAEGHSDGSAGSDTQCADGAESRTPKATRTGAQGAIHIVRTQRLVFVPKAARETLRELIHNVPLAHLAWY
jgi:hypothetical protein